MAIDSIVFDVDGVLVRAGEFGNLLERDHGVSRESQLEFFRGPFRDCVRGAADLREVLVPFLSKWAWPGSVEDLLAVWFEADSTLNHEVLTLAGQLRSMGYRCYVASTQERHRAQYLEDVIGLGKLFDGLFFSCRVRTTKGDPHFFREVGRAIGSDPSAILFFDDVDGIVDTARSEGWNAEVYQFGDDMRWVLSSHGVLVSDA